MSDKTPRRMIQPPTRSAHHSGRVQDGRAALIRQGPSGVSAQARADPVPHASAITAIPILQEHTSVSWERARAMCRIAAQVLRACVRAIPCRPRTRASVRVWPSCSTCERVLARPNHPDGGRENKPRGAQYAPLFINNSPLREERIGLVGSDARHGNPR